MVLHIFVGDNTAGTFKKTGIPGDILVWHESYINGPLDRDMDENVFDMRVQYFDKFGPGRELYITSTKHQQELLNSINKYDKVIIWLEHDIFDQSALVYLLNWFSGKAVSNYQFRMISTNQFAGIENFKGLGQLNADQLSSLWGTQETITTEQLESGRKAWLAITSNNPRDILDFIEDCDNSLPYLKTALKEFISLYPSTENGLNSIEQIIMEQVGKKEGLKAVHYCGDFLNNFDNIAFGDWHYLIYMYELTIGKNPLLQVEGDLISLIKFGDQVVRDHNCRVFLTEVGKKVLDGKEDAIKANGIDRWIGGVHLSGDSKIWRYDVAKNIFTG